MQRFSANNFARRTRSPVICDSSKSQRKSPNLLSDLRIHATPASLVDVASLLLSTTFALFRVMSLINLHNRFLCFCRSVSCPRLPRGSQLILLCIYSLCAQVSSIYIQRMFCTATWSPRTSSSTRTATWRCVCCCCSPNCNAFIFYFHFRFPSVLSPVICYTYPYYSKCLRFLPVSADTIVRLTQVETAFRDFRERKSNIWICEFGGSTMCWYMPINNNTP